MPHHILETVKFEFAERGKSISPRNHNLNSSFKRRKIGTKSELKWQLNTVFQNNLPWLIGTFIIRARISDIKKFRKQSRFSRIVPWKQSGPPICIEGSMRLLYQRENSVNYQRNHLHVRVVNGSNSGRHTGSDWWQPNGSSVANGTYIGFVFCLVPLILSLGLRPREKCKRNNEKKIEHEDINRICVATDCAALPDWSDANDHLVHS